MAISLWGQDAVAQLIEPEFDIELHLRSIGKYLARWGLTMQKLIKHAYE